MNIQVGVSYDWNGCTRSFSSEQLSLQIMSAVAEVLTAREMSRSGGKWSCCFIPCLFSVSSFSSEVGIPKNICIRVTSAFVFQSHPLCNHDSTHAYVFELYL